MGRQVSGGCDRVKPCGWIDHCSRPWARYCAEKEAATGGVHRSSWQRRLSRRCGGGCSIAGTLYYGYYSNSSTRYCISVWPAGAAAGGGAGLSVSQGRPAALFALGRWPAVTSRAVVRAVARAHALLPVIHHYRTGTSIETKNGDRYLAVVVAAQGV